MITGYNERFYAIFKDKFNNTINVDIYQENYTGDKEKIFLSSKNIVISENEKEIKESQLIGTGCILYVINNFNNILKFNELYGTTEKKNYLVITKNNEIIYEGFIIPEIYNQSIKHNPNIKITATNGISELKNKKPNIVKNIKNDYIKLIDIIKEIIYATGIEKPILIKNTIYHPSYTSTFDQNITVFDEMYLPRYYFMDDDEFKNNYEILSEILKSTYSRLYYKNGNWFIDRIKDIKSENTYKKYDTDGTESVITYNHNTIELNDQKIINGDISYIAGIGNYKLDLETDLKENIIKNDFTDIMFPAEYDTHTITETYYTIQSLLWGPVTETYDNVVPLPKRYEWAINTTAMGFLSKSHSDSHIERGMNMMYTDGFDDSNHYPVEGVPPQINIPSTFAVTTRLTIDWMFESNLNVKYKLSIPKLMEVGYRSKFAIRTYNPSNGQTRYLYEDEDNDDKIQLTTDFKTFNNVITGENVRSDGGFIDISKKIDISTIMLYLKNDLNLTNTLDLYIDFFLVEYEVEEDSEMFKPMHTIIGDFEVTSTHNLSENEIIAELSENYNHKNLSTSLSIYDSNSINVINSILLKNGNSFELSRRWKEKKYNIKKDIQIMYLTDLIQNYNKNRYKINTNLIGNINISNGDIINYSHLPDIDFIVIGKEYEISNSKYNLILQEFVDDDGWFIEEELGLQDPEILFVESDNIYADSEGGGYLIKLTSNVEWELSYDSDWISVQPTRGFGDYNISVTADDYILYDYDAETGDEYGPRSATITISSEENTIDITVHQDFIVLDEYEEEE